jgi:hypothetical protein
MFSALPPRADIAHCSRHVCFVQSTKSLRSSPLRGSKSREAGIRSRGQRWRGGKVNTIRSCIVGVQRMVKNSKDNTAIKSP